MTKNTSGRAQWLFLALAMLLAVYLDGATALGQSSPAESAAVIGADDHLIWTYAGGIDQVKDADFVPGEILVGYHRIQIGAAGLDDHLEATALETLDLRGLDGADGDAGVVGYRQAVPVGSEWETIEALLRDPTVAFATPNWIVRAADLDVIHQDEEPSSETPFKVNDTFYAERQWYQQRINASRAWQLAFDHRDPAARPIRVAVIDSGVYREHRDLRSNLLPGYNYLNPGQPPTDDYGHGTHVAGIIGAVQNNALGIAGTAPWIEIEPYKILDREGKGTSVNLAKAIDDATNNGADIINLSLTLETNSPVVATAVHRAALRNVLLIGAAGNWGTRAPVAYPAALADVVAVAATTYDDGHAPYSAVGSTIEIAAPGGTQATTQGQILGTWSLHSDATCATGLILSAGDPYCYIAGTSAAGALVSGVAALVWAVDPSLPSDAIRVTLSRTATKLPYSADKIGSGRVDAYAAVRRLIPTALHPSVNSLYLSRTDPFEPFTATIILTNPSLKEVVWEADLETDVSWVKFVGTGGSTRYGNPGYISMLIRPDLLSGGLGINKLLIRGDSDDGPIALTVPLILDLSARHFYSPMAMSAGAGTSTGSVTPFEWQRPAQPGDRQIFTLGDGSSIEVDLPFSFPIGQGHYSYVRLHSDGVITMPGSTLLTLPDNECLPSALQPVDAIFGWWADLDPGQSGALVSGFPVSSGRYAIEFLNVPTASSLTPAYSVSFQIVLDDDGDIRLNYRDVPMGYDRPPLSTVGVESVDGRFHNRVFCADGDTTLGLPPHPGQTFFLTPGDIY